MLNVSLEHSFKSNLNIKNLNVCFDKKKLYLKQANIFIEMVICVVGDCKSNSRQRKT